MLACVNNETSVNLPPRPVCVRDVWRRSGDPRLPVPVYVLGIWCRDEELTRPVPAYVLLYWPPVMVLPVAG